MSRYIPLETAKYYHNTAESKMVRRYRGRVAIRALLAFFVGLALLPCAVHAGEHLHEWAPMADDWVREVSGGQWSLPRLDLSQMPKFTLGIWG